jgi:hypothetical protein
MEIINSITIFISTIGQFHLKKCLESCLQLNENDNLYIIIDGKIYKNKCEQIIKMFNFRCKLYVIVNEDNLGYWGHGVRNKFQYKLFG